MCSLDAGSELVNFMHMQTTKNFCGSMFADASCKINLLPSFVSSCKYTLYISLVVVRVAI